MRREFPNKRDQMSSSLDQFITDVCREHGNDRTRMMDIVRAVQSQFGCVSSEALDLIAKEVGTHRVEVESVVSFYAFLSERKKGKVVVRLCDDIIDEMQGAQRVQAAFEEELGIAVGQTTEDGSVSLEHAPCIGMCDQAPAALVNDTVVKNLDGEKAREIAREIREKGADAHLVTTLGDGNNAHELVRAAVCNNIRGKGPVILADDYEPGVALRKALAMHPAEVIRDVKTSRLRGRGGAGFPTGMKWDFTRQAQGQKRYVICNADEGEPGTFKDRVILTECPDMMIEGMAIAGYAIGAETGVIYLRGEYAYLRAFLEDRLSRCRDAGLLGKNVGGKEGFDFDIRIQMGAGAYICGEETALISSCEGERGDPKNRPPFPAQKGYLASPTSVNNVETFCCVARILDKGPGWFAQMGSKGSAGTKLLSISGDCMSPGVYEVPFGTPLSEVLAMAGAENPYAVQMGGPSGTMVGEKDFGRTVCYDDLATGGSVMIFDKTRNVIEIAQRFLAFFVEESCGYCTPCRVGTVLLLNKLNAILDGRGEETDLGYLKDLAQTVKVTSRCGLGQTAANPVLNTLESFEDAYRALMKERKDETFLAAFDINEALDDSRELIGRESTIFTS